jgi:outer membrane protein OmpA-like peptidoglycan-associated protein
MTDHTTMTKGRWVMVGLVWFAILSVFVVGVKIWWQPAQEEAKKKAEEQAHDKMVQDTSSQSQYKHTVTINLDSFSGYCLLRSDVFKNECRKKGIRVNLVDDAANYPDRLAALANGDCQMAAFTIDALWKASAMAGDTPAVMVAFVDETKGADAIVAAGKLFPNVDAMNDPGVRIVATPDSPSEFMSRVLMHHYNLPLLPNNPFIEADGAADVYNQYKNSVPTAKRVYALWEPYVSKMTQNPDYHAVVTSDKFRGYIADGIVCSRPFLSKHREVVVDVIKAYLTAGYKYRGKMVELVLKDAAELGEPLRKEQAEQLVKGIWWKNTTEGFSHFGLTSGDGLQHIEDMCDNINEVLVETGAISSDPTNGNYALLYYDGVMRELFDDGWHPGFGSETVRAEAKLQPLSDEEWKQLQPVGTLKVPRLTFSRGGSNLSTRSKATLDSLAQKLETWPQYYLLVKGHSQKSDDPDIQQLNEALATSRAVAAKEYLISKGVGKERINASVDHPNGSTTVQFLLGEIPY